jgi:hypothetical protein
MSDFLFMGQQPERFGRERIYDGSRKPDATGVVYRYIATRRGLLRAGESADWSPSFPVDAWSTGELELEIELDVYGHMEPGYGFCVQSVECEGRDFTITAEEKTRIEEGATEAFADREEQRKSDAVDAAVDARRDR